MTTTRRTGNSYQPKYVPASAYSSSDEDAISVIREVEISISVNFSTTLSKQSAGSPFFWKAQCEGVSTNGRTENEAIGNLFFLNPNNVFSQPHVVVINNRQACYLQLISWYMEEFDRDQIVAMLLDEPMISIPDDMPVLQVLLACLREWFNVSLLMRFKPKKRRSYLIDAYRKRLFSMKEFYLGLGFAYEKGRLGEKDTDFENRMSQLGTKIQCG